MSETTAKVRICQNRLSGMSDTGAAARHPNEKQSTPNPAVKISTITKTRATMTQTLQSSMTIKIIKSSKGKILKLNYQKNNKKKD